MYHSLRLRNTLARHARRGYLPWNTFRGAVETVESFLARPEVDGDAFVVAHKTSVELVVRPVGASWTVVCLVRAAHRSDRSAPVVIEGR